MWSKQKKSKNLGAFSFPLQHPQTPAAILHALNMSASQKTPDVSIYYLYYLYSLQKNHSIQYKVLAFLSLVELESQKCLSIH